MEFLSHIPFVEHLGLELVRCDGGHARIDLRLRDELTNSFAVAHGGVLMTLLDVAMAHAARSPDQAGGEPRPGVVTIEMKTSFVRPGEGHMTAVGRVLHRASSLVFCEGSVLEDGGALVAHSTGTFKHLRALPVGGRNVNALHGSD
jgi:uncharacterized protein (TIGR00369 family)